MQPDSIIQNYRLLRPLGDGGMGHVWLAEHLLLGRKVAVKSLHPHLIRNSQLRARFKQEARTLAQLHHPHIVALHDYFEEDDSAWLVMEYVEGLALQDLIRYETGPIPVPQLLPLFTQILEGFIYAHGKGVVHRDIKPCNFLVTLEGNIKILDFGIAKVRMESDARLTQPGMHLGTIFYMSPEQVKGEEMDVRSDVYSLGVTLFEMVTGQCPYPSDATDYDVYDRIVNHPFPLASTFYPGTHPQIEAIIAKATRKKPEDRYQNCQEFLEALRKVQNGIPQPHPASDLPAEGSEPTGIHIHNIGHIEVAPARPEPAPENMHNLKRMLWVALIWAVSIVAFLAVIFVAYRNIFQLDWSNRTAAAERSADQQEEDKKAEAERQRKEDERRKEGERRKEAERLEQERIAREKQVVRNNLDHYFHFRTNDYSYSILGGIYDLTVTVENNSKYRLDHIEVEVHYIKANGGTYKVETLMFYGIEPHSYKLLPAPDSDRGVDVKLNTRSMSSRELELCVPAAQGNPADDPYHCE